MKTDDEVDAVGLLCPLPVLRLRKRMQALDAGETITLIADDPAAIVDVPHFCNEQGHEMIGSEQSGKVLRFVIRKGKK